MKSQNIDPVGREGRITYMTPRKNSGTKLLGTDCQGGPLGTGRRVSCSGHGEERLHGRGAI